MTQHACAGEPALDLLLALKCDNQIMGALFSPATRNAFRVGAPGEAEFGICGRSARAIEFYVERQANALVLIPGYCERQLRINGVYATGPLALPERFVVELGAIVVLGRLYARQVASLREEPRSCIELVPASRLPDGCFEQGISHAEGMSARPCLRTNDVSREQAETREIAAVRRGPSLPCGLNTTITDHRQSAGPSGYEPTAIVPNMTVVLGASPVSETSREKIRLVAEQVRTTGTQLVSRADVLPLHATNSLHSDVSPLVANVPSFRPLGASVALAPELLSQSATAVSVRAAAEIGALALAISDFPPVVERALLEPVAKSPKCVASVEVPPLDLAKPQAFSAQKKADDVAAALEKGPVSGRCWQAETRAYSASDVPLVSLPTGSILAVKSPAVEAQRTIARNRPKPKQSLLFLIGGWARKRPIVVFALATTSGLLLALMAALFWRSGLHHRKTENPIVSVTTNVAESSASGGVEPSASAGPAEAEKKQRPATADTAGDRASKGSMSEIRTLTATPGSANSAGECDAAAIEHLLSGRHNDALRVYEKRIERVPSDEVSKAIARILRMKLSGECDNKGGTAAVGVNCPEILP